MFKQTIEDQTIEVMGHLGLTRQMTRLEFVQRWVALASDLLAIDIDIRAATAHEAGKAWDRMWRAENTELDQGDF